MLPQTSKLGYCMYILEKLSPSDATIGLHYHQDTSWRALQKAQSEKRQKEYEVTIDKAKKQVQKILSENKNKLNLEIQKKRRTIENEIEKEIQKAQKEIILLKKESVNHISKISEEVTAKVIEEISGDKLNESSIKAAVLETSKSHLKKYLWI